MSVVRPPAVAIPTPTDLPQTGNCYEQAVEIMLRFRCVDRGDYGPTLVHGRPTLTVPPYCQFGHAWVVLPGGRTVLDVSGAHVPIRLYYRAGKIDRRLNYNYTLDQMIHKLRTFKHYGPWEGPDAMPPHEED